jgi:tetraacyldisaccharide 4'-kinase
MPVAVAARAYRARPGRPRKVTPHDSPNLVGDEALALVRALGPGVPVVVAPERAGALHLAAELAPLVIADGLLQTRPRRIALSVLALDADAPWGSGACPPAGDLRAAPRELLLAADLVVLGSNEASTSSPWTVPDGRQVLVWRSTLLGARTAAGELLRVGHLAGLRLGIALAIARPGRVLRELAAHGIRPAVTRYAPDHARPTAGRGQSFGLDAWLATAKCATKLGPTLAGVPVWVLEHAVELPRELVAAALGRGPSSDAP